MPQSTTLNYLSGDHPSTSLRTSLGSTSLAVNASTGEVVTTRYREASRREKSIINSETVIFIGGYYKKKGSEITKYYGVYPEPRRRAGASRIAVSK